MSRTKIIGGNWKMNLTAAEAQVLAAALKAKVAGSAEVVVFPSFPYLIPVSAALAGSKIAVGAQDFWIKPNGAFTGEVSLAQIKDCGASWALVGHSERRHVIGERDSLLNDKVHAALNAGVKVILCVGEQLAERESGKTDAVNAGQISLGLAGVKAEQMKDVVIAYEPVWAIGTGKTATPADAQLAHQAIRAHLQAMFGASVASAVRIQYGGSMNAANAAELMAQPDIDGGLIGGAALKPDDFAAIVVAAK
jgi:triosephosphate isomerase